MTRYWDGVCHRGLIAHKTTRDTGPQVETTQRGERETEGIFPGISKAKSDFIKKKTSALKTALARHRGTLGIIV